MKGVPRDALRIHTPETLLALGVRQESGCITVGLPTKSARYWLVHHNGRALHAHRLMWILKNGEPAPGMKVCHRCDNPRCINPDHLFLGTHADNMRDCNAKGRRHWVSDKNRLSNHEVSKVRFLLAQGLRHRIIAEHFSVSTATIDRISAGKTHAQKEVQAV